MSRRLTDGITTEEEVMAVYLKAEGPLSIRQVLVRLVERGWQRPEEERVIGAVKALLALSLLAPSGRKGYFQPHPRRGDHS